MRTSIRLCLTLALLYHTRWHSDSRFFSYTRFFKPNAHARKSDLLRCPPAVCWTSVWRKCQCERILNDQQSPVLTRSYHCLTIQIHAAPSSKYFHGYRPPSAPISQNYDSTGSPSPSSSTPLSSSQAPILFDVLLTRHRATEDFSIPCAATKVVSQCDIVNACTVQCVGHVDVAGPVQRRDVQGLRASPPEFR